MSTPTVTRLAGGQLRLDWPEGLLTTEIAREVLVEMVDQLNQLRAENEQLRASIDFIAAYADGCDAGMEAAQAEAAALREAAVLAVAEREEPGDE